MKNILKIANIYAKSLYIYADELKKSDLVYHDMKKIEIFLKKFPNIKNYYLNNPLINKEIKLDFVYNIFKFSCDISKKFYNLVFLKKRDGILLDISIEYQKIYEWKKNIVKLIIISAIPLNDYYYNKILNFLKKIFKNNVKYEIINKINKSLIGGFCLYIGDKKWDYSIKNNLIQLKEKFL